MTWSQATAEEYSELGGQSHVPILATVLRELIGDAHGKSLLDVGCGRAELTLQVARGGYARVHCIDESRTLIDEAGRYVHRHAPHEATRFTFQHADETVLPTAQSFDVVLSSLAVMMCQTRDRLHHLMHGLITSTSRQGQLLIVITHPCFRRSAYATFHYELPEHYDYWTAGQAYDMVLEPKYRSRTTITDCHWPLESYAAAITHAGGVIHAIRELPCAYHSDGRPDGPPAYLILAVQHRLPDDPARRLTPSVQ